MTATILRFKLDDQFDAGKLEQIAAGARDLFVDMPGLKSKAFTLDADAREAVNVYLWQDPAAAQAFFTPEIEQRVTQLYGTRPTIQHLTVLDLVNNDAE